MAGELTQRMLSFCAEYLVDGNGTQAAIRAGYSPNGADVTGTRLLRDPRIRARLHELRREMGDTYDAVWIRERLGQIASEDRSDRVAALTALVKITPELRFTDSSEGAKHLHLHGLNDAQLAALMARLPDPLARDDA